MMRLTREILPKDGRRDSIFLQRKYVIARDVSKVSFGANHNQETLSEPRA